MIEEVRMPDERSPFEYKSLPQIPAEYRRADWTFIEVADKTFAEGEAAFDALKLELCEAFAGNAFAQLHLLRGVESRLLMLAMRAKEPVETCLERLRRRLDLEYGRYEIHSKAAEAVVVADYVAKAGETKLAKSLLAAEKRDLEETAEFCRSLLDTINQRLKQWE